MKVNILGVFFDSVTMKEATQKILKLLNGHEKSMVITANPEIIMEAQKSSSFCAMINRGDLVVADGIGVVIGSKIIKKPLPERVAGFDLVQHIFDAIKNTNKTVYFFGAAPHIAELAAKEMRAKYKNLKIVGTHDGYFDEEEEKVIIEEINRLKPDLLLVGLGAPRQEKWWYTHKEQLNVKVCIGVGGSFDGWSGKVKRAPKIFINLGLEWFYRLIKQPTRLKRMLRLPVFLLLVIKKRKQFL